MQPRPKGAKTDIVHGMPRQFMNKLEAVSYKLQASSFKLQEQAVRMDSSSCSLQLSTCSFQLVAGHAPQARGSVRDDLGLAQVRQANAVLGLLDFTLAADRPQAYAVQGLLVAHDGTDEDRRADHGA